MKTKRDRYNHIVSESDYIKHEKLATMRHLTARERHKHLPKKRFTS